MAKTVGESVLALLHSQEVCIGEHPEMYSPDQVRKAIESVLEQDVAK